MNKIIYVSYATEDSPYVDLLNKSLIPSLLRNGLNVDTEITENRHNWSRNTQLKANIVYKMLIKWQCPIVMLDADAVVLRYPALFETLGDYDVAFHNLDTELFWKGKSGKKREPLTGTMFFNYTEKGQELAARWCGINDNNEGDNDMNNFREALTKVEGLKIYQLPLEYVAIVKFNNEIPDCIKDPVIKHMQASRKYRRLK